MKTEDRNAPVQVNVLFPRWVRTVAKKLAALDETTLALYLCELVKTDLANRESGMFMIRRTPNDAD